MSGIATVCGCISDEGYALFKRALDDEYSAEPAIEAIRMALEIAGLIEHGISIRGGFPTTEGRELRESLPETIE